MNTGVFKPRNLTRQREENRRIGTGRAGALAASGALVPAGCDRRAGWPVVDPRTRSVEELR